MKKILYLLALSFLTLACLLSSWLKGEGASGSGHQVREGGCRRSARGKGASGEGSRSRRGGCRRNVEGVWGDRANSEGRTCGLGLALTRKRGLERKTAARKE